MNTLHERLGVAVEADAARFSGEEFADAWGGDVAGRVKRRRQVRAAAYSGGTMLAAGALVLGGAKLPWATLAGPAGLGGIDDCVPVSPSAAESMVYTQAVDIEGGAASWQIPGRDLEAPARYTLTYPSDRVERGVTVVTADGTTTDLEFDADGRATFTGEDGRLVVVTLSESDGSIVTSVESNANGTQASPSASVDCVTPTPTPAVSASPSPSVLPLDVPEVQQGFEGSPFSIGFEFPSEEFAFDQLYVADVTWFTPDEANSAMRAMYQLPSDAPQAAGSDLVARVTIADRLGGQAAFTGGMGSTRDPELLLDGGASQASHSNPGAYFVQGASFVAVRDGVVVGVLKFIEEPEVTPAMNYDTAYDTVEPHWARDMWATLLNPEGAFVDASGVPITDEYETYVVAGAGLYDLTGNYSGTYYIWKKLDRP